MAVDWALQESVYNALVASQTLGALLAESIIDVSPSHPAIYDHVPQVEASEDESLFPYVVIGETTAIPFDTDDRNGQEHTITLHVWSRAHGREEAKRISQEIYAALHNVNLAVSGADFVYCLWEFSETIPDPDERTKHMVTRFRVVTLTHQ